MPLGNGVRYRYKHGSDVRLAFKGNRVIEAKNTTTGATHTPAEFAKDRQTGTRAAPIQRRMMSRSR